NLRNIAVRNCPRGKFALTFVDKDVKRRLVESRVGRVTVKFPIAIHQIDLDATANRFAAVDADRRIGKIWAGFTIPGAELDDVDVIASLETKLRPNSPANQRACSSSSLGVLSGRKSARSRTRETARIWT